jgi:DNA-binding HxlR family transcriptional regulator
LNPAFAPRRDAALITATQVGPHRAILGEETTHRIILMLKRQPHWTAKEVSRAFRLDIDFAVCRLYRLESLGLVWRCTKVGDLEWALTDAGEGLQSALIAIAESVSEGACDAQA